MTTRGRPPRAKGPYWRKQRGGSEPRAWADFRSFGGKREPLCEPGEAIATTDPVIAAQLYASRLAALTDGGTHDSARPSKREGAISQAASKYLEIRRAGSQATSIWLDQTEGFLERAVRFFSSERQLRTIKPSDVAAWVVQLRTEDSGKGGTFSEETIRKHIHALSGLFRRAQRDGWAPQGWNPVELLDRDERPGRDPSPDVWLEVTDAAKLLEAARTYRAGKREPRMQLAYPLLATFLLTGGRADEVLGLDLTDLLFDRNLIAFRPNAWRRGKKGKTAGSARMVPMWPQLEGILREYLQGYHLELRLKRDPGLTLLFPSPETGNRIIDIRKLVDRVAERAGLPEGIYRATAFRKTYASARLQTLDNGAPIAPRTVQGELGHRSGDMIEKVYGRLGAVRHRSVVVEYRIKSEGQGPVAEHLNPDMAPASSAL